MARAPAMTSNVSLALQAGGASSRMGRNKALVPFEGGTLIEWMLRRTRGLFGHVFIVSNEPAGFRHLDVPVVTDAVGERGSVVGIYTSLLAAPTPYVLCLACDVPFVPTSLLLDLAVGAPGWDALVPRHGDYLEPLAAVYRRAGAGVFEDFLGEGGRRIKTLYDRLRVGYLDVDPARHGDPERAFLNVNTPEQLEQARELARAGEGLGPAALVPSKRVAAFLERSPVPVVSVVGRKKSGKTTLLADTIAELAARGVRVAALKHDRHGFEIDLPGTDSHRFRAGGAVATAISGPRAYAWVHDVEGERGLEEIIARLGEPVDLLLTEGYKHGPAPKIEVLGGGLPGDSHDLVSPADELLAVVAPLPGGRAPEAGAEGAADVPPGVARIDAGDGAALADLLIERVVHRHAVATGVGR